MRFTVRVKPGSKHASILRINEGEYEVHVTERPEKGKATNAVRKALARHLGLPPSRLSLVMGSASHTKVFEVI